MIAPERDLLSTAKLCELLQASPGTIDRAIERANVEPALRLNGCRYFSDGDVDAIRRALPKLKGQQ